MWVISLIFPSGVPPIQPIPQKRNEADGAVAYRRKWLVPITRVQSVSGDPEYLKCTLNVVDELRLGKAHMQLPRRRLLRCSSQILYEQLLSSINVALQVCGGGVMVCRGCCCKCVSHTQPHLTGTRRPGWNSTRARCCGKHKPGNGFEHHGCTIQRLTGEGGR